MAAVHLYRTFNQRWLRASWQVSGRSLGSNANLSLIPCSQNKTKKATRRMSMSMTTMSQRQQQWQGQRWQKQPHVDDAKSKTVRKRSKMIQKRSKTTWKLKIARKRSENVRKLNVFEWGHCFGLFWNVRIKMELDTLILHLSVVTAETMFLPDLPNSCFLKAINRNQLMVAHKW